MQIFDEFNELYKAFTEVTYDCMDPQDDVSYLDSITLSLLLIFIYNYIIMTNVDLRYYPVLIQPIEHLSI